MERDSVCTRTIALDSETLNIAMGRDWVCTRTITIDDWVTLNRAKGADWYSVYKDHSTRLRL